MGEVWLAQDNELGVHRALKFAPPEVAADARSVAMLKREAIAGTSLAHPNIVRIFDFAHDPAEMESAVIMEVVEGRSLAELQAKRIEEAGDGFFEPAEIEGWVREACMALDYAHGESRVHRDLKPQNLMIETASQRLKIMDFGISRRIGDSFSQLTGKDSSGTLPYMSPQQVMGDPPSASDDIYGLGATLYDLLSGSPPFIGGALETQVRDKVPPSILQRRAEVNASTGKPVPAAWEAVVMACMEKEREKRPKNAAAILQATAAPVPKTATAALPKSDRQPAAEKKPNLQESEVFGDQQRRLTLPALPIQAKPESTDKPRDFQEGSSNGAIFWVCITFCIALGTPALVYFGELREKTNYLEFFQFGQDENWWHISNSQQVFLTFSILSAMLLLVSTTAHAAGLRRNKPLFALPVLTLLAIASSAVAFQCICTYRAKIEPYQFEQWGAAHLKAQLADLFSLNWIVWILLGASIVQLLWKRSKSSTSHR